MKPKYIIFLLLNLNLYSFSQHVVVGLTNGTLLAGKLLTISPKQVVLDPEGSVEMLKLFAPEIRTVKFVEEGMVLTFPISEGDIPAKFIRKENRNKSKLKGSYYDNYFGLYVFGGFSSKHTLNIYNGSSTAIQTIYKNGGLGGFGAEYMRNYQNRKSEFIFDMDMSLVDTKVLYNTNSELYSGCTLSFDMDINYYPFQASGKVFPKPFLFCGLGLKAISLQTPDASVLVLENFLNTPFGFGLRFNLSDNVTFLVRERFITTKLEGVDNFIMPETRFELHFTIGKW